MELEKFKKLNKELDNLGKKLYDKWIELEKNNEEEKTMNNLEELKKKYEELGKEIERLEKEKSCKRWRADMGEIYFHVDTFGEISKRFETEHSGDNFRYKTRNYFKTKEEAQRHLDNINTYYELMDLAEELNNGKKFNWNNHNQLKHKLIFDYTLGALVPETNTFLKEIGQIYCLDRNFAEIALKRIGKERLEKLFKEE